MDLKDVVCVLETIGSGSQLSNEKDKEPACAIAIKALNKQIPKKPMLEGDGYDNEGNMIYDTWICPNCDAHYEVDYDDYNYCPICGQKVDLSDIN